MQHPHSPPIGNEAGVGCTEQLLTCCNPSGTWAGARDSALEGQPCIRSALTRSRGASRLIDSHPAREHGGRNGSDKGPRSASFGMAGLPAAAAAIVLH